jgi:hypothetical protein
LEEYQNHLHHLDEYHLHHLEKKKNSNNKLQLIEKGNYWIFNDIQKKAYLVNDKITASLFANHIKKNGTKKFRYKGYITPYFNGYKYYGPNTEEIRKKLEEEEYELNLYEKSNHPIKVKNPANEIIILDDDLEIRLFNENATAYKGYVFVEKIENPLEKIYKD